LVSDDREKLSFSERDKRRREKQRSGGSSNGGSGGSNGSAGSKTPRRSRWASDAYKKRVDERLFGRKGDAARQRLEDRLRESQGSPAFLRTYREYVRDYGMPEDMQLLLLLLDLEDEREGLKVMEALEARAGVVPVEQKNLLRGRLRNLEMSTSSDLLADAATSLLSRL
jgi:hypothetical protein